MADDKNRTTNQQTPELPPVSFIEHITELAFTARAYMGGMVDQETQKPVIHLEMARRLIDTIEMLQKKTEGNLEAPERNFLENTLYELRMTYVRLATAPPPEQPSQEESASEESPPSEAASETSAPDESPGSEQAQGESQAEDQNTPENPG